MIRSRFLVHWTGKDIHANRKSLTDAKRAEYIDRLADILDYGFWMTTPKERVCGAFNSFLDYNAPMTCFTEIRLSQASVHASHYGLLGVGVDRTFVLDRFGGPVQYVRNSEDESVVWTLHQVWNSVVSTKNKHLEQCFAFAAAFLKSMSKKRDDFMLMEEHEWRIVHHPTQQERDAIIPSDTLPPRHRVPIPPEGLRLLVFPDATTRHMAWADARVNAKLAVSRPIAVTIEECEHF